MPSPPRRIGRGGSCRSIVPSQVEHRWRRKSLSRRCIPLRRTTLPPATSSSDGFPRRPSSPLVPPAPASPPCPSTYAPPPPPRASMAARSVAQAAPPSPLASRTRSPSWRSSGFIPIKFGRRPRRSSTLAASTRPSTGSRICPARSYFTSPSAFSSSSPGKSSSASS